MKSYSLDACDMVSFHFVLAAADPSDLDPYRASLSFSDSQRSFGEWLKSTPTCLQKV